jgi:hypothetical protein
MTDDGRLFSAVGVAFLWASASVLYPGSSYTLIYHSQQDMMTGIYFQATMGQSFEVMFVRAK